MIQREGLRLLEASAAGGAYRARLRLEPESPLLSGHFPGRPILPGIAQLGLALDGARSLAERDLTLLGVRGVRFRRALEPGDVLELVVAPGVEAGALRFELRSSEALASSGTLMVRVDVRG